MSFEGNALPELVDRLGASFITRDERLYAGSWWNITMVTADYTATYGDVYISCDTTAGNITITLPVLADSLGKVYVIKKTSSDANTVTIDGDTAETIDGATTRVISRQFETYVIIANGTTDWRIMSAFSPSAVVAPTAGTTGTLAKFTSANTIGDSIISESGTTATVTGDLAFSGNARRISGEMAAASPNLANRLHFMPSNANTNGYLGLIASGTATQSVMRVLGGSDAGNAPIIQLISNTTYADVQSTRAGTGTTVPMRLVVGANAIATLSTSGAFWLNRTSASLLTDALGNLEASGSIGASTSFVAGSAAAPGSPADGQFWNDSTQKALTARLSGINQVLVGTIFTQTADKTVTNTTTETSIIGTGVGTLTLPANFWVAGKTIRITQYGYWSQPGSTSNTRTFRVKVGSTTLISKALAITITAVTNESYAVSIDITCRTTGASGTLYSQGLMQKGTTSGLANIFTFPTTAAVTVDTTASAALDMTWQWGTAATNVSITTTNTTVEVLN